MSEPTQSLSVGIILIGNELLSGKIEDQNGHYAARRLRALGAELKRLCVIPDVLEDIVSEVRRCSQAYDVVITSGGVGPTHDDITLEAIAEAFGVETELHPDLEELISGFFKERVTQDHLRMARIPMGSDLVNAGSSTWPIVKKENLYVLPGVPQIFRAKFEVLADSFRVGRWFLRSIYLNAEEGDIARHLEELESRFDVSVGSYPRWRDTDYRVRITIEARTPDPVNRAVEHVLTIISPEQIVRYDPDFDVSEGR